MGGAAVDCPIIIVDASNHYVFLQHPRELAAAMRTFLGSQSVAASKLPEVTTTTALTLMRNL